MRTITRVLIAGGLLFVAAGPTMASVNIYLDPTVGDTVSFAGVAGYTNQVFYYGGGAYYGGPFMGTLGNGAAWTTFCVEADGGDENIVLGSTYTVSSLDPHVAKDTGNNVTDEAKWLYWQYGHGLLPESFANLPVGTTWTVNDLQMAIWHGVWTKGGVRLDMYLADGKTSAYGPAAADLYELADAAFADTDPVRLAQAQAEADCVYVLNPASGGVNGTQAQSMLYAVPEPATILVWSLLGASWLGIRVWRHGRRVGRQRWSDENRTAILEIVGKR